MIPKKILIVDDEKMIRITTTIILKKQGIEVIDAENGEKGLKKARSEKPDLILLDIMMPGMTGWHVIEELQKDPETIEIPIIIFTAGNYIEAEKKAKTLGITKVIRKPFRIQQINDVLASL